MKPTTTRWLVLVLGVGLSLCSSGCIDDYRSFFIRQNQVPSSGCVLNTTTTTFNTRGRLDVLMKTGYWLFPLIENHMGVTKSGDGDPERNTLIMRGFEIELDMQEIPGAYANFLTDRFEPISGYLPPGSKMSAAVKIIPDELVQTLNIPRNYTPVIMATVRAVATQNGSTKRSSAFVFPVEICNRCLVDFRETCPAATDKTIKTNVCGYPQDLPVTCCRQPDGSGKCYTPSS